MAKRSKQSPNPDKLGTPGFTRRSLTWQLAILYFLAIYGVSHLAGAPLEMLRSPLYVVLVAGGSMLLGSFWARRIRPDLFGE